MERLVEFIKSITHANAPNACFGWISGKEFHQISNQGCHAYLPTQPKEQLDCFGSGMTCAPENIEVFKVYWDWLTDQEKSPWRMITRDINLVRGQDQLPRGWIIDREILDTVDFALIKNFAIATRTFHEYPHRHKTFYELIKRFDLDPRDAYFLSGYMTYESDRFIAQGNGHTGIHWALTNPVGKSFWQGNPSRKTSFNSKETVNYHFLDTRVRSFPIYKTSDKFVKGEVVKSNFGDVQKWVVDVPQALEKYYEWKKHILE